MKKILLCTFLLTFLATRANDLLVENVYAGTFRKAYSLHPSIPKGLLEAVAYTQSRFQHLQPSDPGSCIGYPGTYGVMGLIQDGKGYFRNNLVEVAQRSHYSEAEIIRSPESCILAYAKAFAGIQAELRISSDDPADYIPVLKALSEIPADQDLQNDFAMSTHLYQIYWFLSRSEFQDFYNFPDHRIDLKKIFGDNYRILSAKSLVASEQTIQSGEGAAYKLVHQVQSLSPDYPPALWNAAAACNYSNRNGTAISAVTIHDIEGTYAGCISWFKNCNANASAHYVLRSSDGQITQMVLEANKAWHVGTENPYTIGLEHEGYVNSPNWYTNAMYNSSGALVKDICTDNNINPLRTYYGPGCSGSSNVCGLGACTKVKGHQMFPNQSHTDPGPYWNWAKYYKIINNTYSVTATYTTNNGSFYDSGGPLGNYGNDERKFWRFTKAGATNITLSFNSFAVENGWDHLFIYNGGSVFSPLVGQFTGSVNPGPVTSVNDSVLVEFRSDCNTTAAGWNASFVMNGTVNPNPDNVAPVTTVSTTGAWKTAAFSSTITDVDNVGGSGVQKGYYQVIDFDGSDWRANYTKGFLADNFDNAIHPEWTVKTGSWSVQGNALVQSDENSPAAGNTNIYAALTQSLSNRYLYHFLAKFEGAGNTRRAGFHFFCDQPDSSNRNNSYFVWFRLDDQKVQIYKVVNNVFGLPKVDLPLTFNAGQWYDIKTVYDRITGLITVYWNNTVIASWTDPSPYTNGSHVSFRSGNCKFSVDEIKVYRSRAATVNVSVGSGLANELRYQNPNPLTCAGKIKSICQDSAGNLSAIHYHDLNVDWTPPGNVAYINDGTGADISILNTTDSISANWGSSADPHSAVMKYWYSIGTAPGSTNVLGWTSNWASTAVTVHSLNLIQNTTYYFNVRSENGAGLLSNVISSNGQTVDTLALTGVSESGAEGPATVYPNPFTSEIRVSLKHTAEAKVALTLYDLLGRILLFTSVDLKNAQEEIILPITDPGLSRGTYFLKLETGGQSHRYKLLKAQ